MLDTGCGSGRVTAELLKRIPDGELIAVDGSEAMIAKARERLGEGVTYVVTDLLELGVEHPVDLVFSTATFHWITNHDRLFERLHSAVRPNRAPGRPMRRRRQRRRVCEKPLRLDYVRLNIEAKR